MRKFIINTTSESSDHYTYFIEHPQYPTIEELDKFLRTYGTDYDDERTYENIDRIIEIDEVEFLKIPE